jgi:hypothetical protein
MGRPGNFERLASMSISLASALSKASTRTSTRQKIAAALRRLILTSWIS